MPFTVSLVPFTQMSLRLCSSVLFFLNKILYLGDWLTSGQLSCSFQYLHNIPPDGCIILLFVNQSSPDGSLGCLQSFAIDNNTAIIFSGFQALTFIKIFCKRSYCISLPGLSVISRTTRKHSKQGSPARLWSPKTWMSCAPCLAPSWS